jgi:hypothetical protein
MASLQDKNKKPMKSEKKSGPETKSVNSSLKGKSTPRMVESKSKTDEKSGMKGAKKAPAKDVKSPPKPKGDRAAKPPVEKPAKTRSGAVGAEETTPYIAYPQSTIEGARPHAAGDLENAIVAIESSKYELTPPGEIVEPIYPEERQTELPARYNETRLVLMVRDPEWLYVYWDIADADRDALRMAPGRFSESLVVRLHDITDVEDFNGINSISWYELPVGRSQAYSWYVHLPQSDREWCGELGVLNDQGEFIQICRSNRVRTPRNFISEETDAAWMSVSEEFRQILAKSADVAVSSGLSSAAAIRQISRKLRLALEQRAGSGGLSGSFRPRPAAVGLAEGQEDLPLIVRTELILSGKTDPHAVLTVQERPVPLRPDGTFTLRFELPDGEQELAVEARNRRATITRRVVPFVRKETRSSS